MPRNPLNPRLSNGERIREVCEITERLGKATSPMVRARMTGPQTTSNAAKYCSRAAHQGLLLADRTVHPVLYQAAPDWRERFALRNTKPGPAEDDDEILLKPRFTGDQVLSIARSNRVPSSVWALGANI
jgi:hypothetical protein